tara:strand:- start:61582 stop:62073 length:492 start_codon:yes stop_codon:yes gene_type:complete
MRLLRLTIVLLLSGQSYASPQLVATLGQTVSAAPYLTGVVSPKPITLDALPSDKPATISYAIKTPGLTPGLVSSRAVHLPSLMHPIYIIGDDALSKQWLSRYHATLEKQQALGLIVNVKNKESYDTLVKQYGIHPLPVNGGVLAKHFKITHYPVLISQHAIEQ